MHPDLIDAIGAKVTWGSLLQVRESARLAIRVLEIGKNARKRGRSVDLLRLRLVGDVARVLAASGIRITKSRSGTFAMVLAVVLVAAEGTAPEDLFPIIKQALALSDL